MSRNRAWWLPALVLIMLAMLAALLPCADIDGDGMSDSLLTEGLLLGAQAHSCAPIPSLFTERAGAGPSAMQQFSARFLQPPI